MECWDLDLDDFNDFWALTGRTLLKKPISELCGVCRLINSIDGIDIGGVQISEYTLTKQNYAKCPYHGI